MDRNDALWRGLCSLVTVALRKESVDRNLALQSFCAGKPVALRKESVDRNTDLWLLCDYSDKSLSARRAWIEIAKLPAQCGWEAVALRKESVDRNGI